MSEFCFEALFSSFVDLELGGLEGRGFDEVELIVSRQLLGEPEERLLEVVVGFSGYVVVLEVLLTVERDLLSLDLWASEASVC